MTTLALAAGFFAGQFHRSDAVRAVLRASDGTPKQQPYGRLDVLLDREVAAAEARWRRDGRALLDARSEIADHLRAFIETAPRLVPDPHARVERWFERDGVEVSLVSVEAFPGFELVCALLKPTAPGPPRPGILAIHGTNGTLQKLVEDVDYHHGFAMALARSGFVVVAPYLVASSDAAMHRVNVKAIAAGTSVDAIELRLLERALDILVTTSGVDPTRVGVYGISRGGMLALRLGALDARLSLVVCSGFFAHRRAWIFEYPRELTSEYYLPAISSSGPMIDDMNLVALIYPRHLAIEVGERDPRYAIAKQEFARVAQLYADITPVNAALLVHPGRHEIAISIVRPFIERWAAAREVATSRSDRTESTERAPR